jgi:hypothetical protein
LNNLVASSSSQSWLPTPFRDGNKKRKKDKKERKHTPSQMDHFKATFKDHPILVVGGTWSTVLGATMLYVRQQKIGLGFSSGC